MRDKDEIMKLILDIARENEDIRAVTMEGSRANPAIPPDEYQDYDITYYVEKIDPYYNNPTLIEEWFGKPLIMQMPEAMRYPDGGGHFNYMMIYEDMNRLDLTFTPKKVDDGFKTYEEPYVILLDKDNGNGFVPLESNTSEKIYHIQPPSSLFYYSCCNNFWWCLNNVAKGIARDELPYVMNMYNNIVRPELHEMIAWYIGITYGFDISIGKDSKYIKQYLPSDIYELYKKTYSSSDYSDIWSSIYVICDLFHILAITVAKHFGYDYRQHEEDGIRIYLNSIRTG